MSATQQPPSDHPQTFGAELKQMDKELIALRHRAEAATAQVAAWMMERGYATGHGDTVADLLGELEGQARARGRDYLAASRGEAR